MDRAEATGLGVAVSGHLALLAALSLGLATATIPKQSEPIEVSFVDETGLESASPTPSDIPPAPKLAELEGPVEPVVQPLPPPPPEPARVPRPQAAEPTPVPKPSPKPRPQPKAKAEAPARPKTEAPAKSETRPTGRLSGLLKGVSDSDSDSRSTATPGKVASAAVRNSLGAEVRRQVRPHWRGNAPTGADAEKLRTILDIALARSGAVVRVEVVETTGQTASNRPQVKLHQEKAIRAVRLAAPFNLPSEYYDAWKSLTISFDKSLAQ
ncbi:cell envelope biogenesis protein TolA [Sphingosinicella rhizophila]|uniref:Cell envelope biogenesis protein TolA n=1 Tax=Sphingosinicella rhizophila TaxID=3050082 RepID=A0ABU3QCP5_9SPHN|nr:cell envelope biogenesis protein TolA [Sphingosinicella sp. GR2756]MDT9600919.1 cell envelope biogenesis protein TolA [Sphingosinicella sp. GR2756]